MLFYVLTRIIRTTVIYDINLMAFRTNALDDAQNMLGHSIAWNDYRYNWCMRNGL